MNELLAVLLTLSAQITQLPLPATLPNVVEVSAEEVQARSGANDKDLYIFTDPSDSTIYVTKGIDYKLTFARAELLQEVVRYTLTVNGIYNPKAPCAINVPIQATLTQIEYDFIKSYADRGKYLGFGVPELEELPEHVFYCTPDATPEIKEELKV
jgi:hypothetical protein